MIRSELDVLLDKVEDPALRVALQSQIDRLKQRRSFGLVFEQHIPERVRLPQHPIRVGSQVVSRDDDESPTFEVMGITDAVATITRVREADGAYLERGEHDVRAQERAGLDSLVVISDFGQPVLPGFRHLGSVERGGNKPYHVVINGENHHALEALRFTHAGKVDCIYIDPPYNSGARDWKYNNDYVDDADAYRHSKWLAFMERRLRLAKQLLNLESSVLIVTIDEKEHLRLGMLLEQTFAGARIQMVSITISPRGTSRANEFSRIDEFAFFVFLGDVSLSGATPTGEAAVEARCPMVFERNVHLDPAVFAFLESLPSIPTPDRTASPLRRARTLARLLADDGGGAPLLADAGADLTMRLDLRLDGLAAEHAADVEENVKDLLTTSVARTRITTAGEDLGAGAVVAEIATHARDVARDAQRAIDSVREGVGKAWFAHRLVVEPGADRDTLRIRCAALLRVDGIAAKVESTATDWVKERLDQFRVQILNTIGAARDAYTRVQEQTTVPEAVTVQLRQNERAATKDSKGDDLPRFAGHLFADAEGTFPVALNDWERTVVEAELARPGFEAWYRNPGSATPASLRIAYQNDEDVWASLQPDFIVVSRRSDGTFGVAIVDPHGDYLADARAKLQALAAFAEQFDDRFLRIESVAKVEDGSLRVLDLADPSVRGEVGAFQGAKVSALYQSDHSRPYP